MCRQTEEVGPTVGLPRHIHFVGFSNVQVQAPTRGQPFYGYYKKTVTFQSLFTTRMGIRRTYFILKPFGSPRGSLFKYFLIYYINLNVFLFILLI